MINAEERTRLFINTINFLESLIEDDDVITIITTESGKRFVSTRSEAIQKFIEAFQTLLNTESGKRVYKIYSPEQGLFSVGGIAPSFGKDGKQWNTVGTLKNHFNQNPWSEDHNPNLKTHHLYTDEDVVVEYELVEVKRTPIKDWIKEHE